MDIIILIVILVFSAIIHEYMHGWMADFMGDSTAKDAGRLTLNPIPHIDPVMTIFVPILFLIGSNFQFVFGGAKPVPINLYNLRDQKYGPAWVALAGPLGNFIIAVIFSLIIRFSVGFMSVEALTIMYQIIRINLLLMIFNLIPIPPLDGSKILATFLPTEARLKFYELERYGMIFVMMFLFVGFDIVIFLINMLMYFLLMGM